MFEIMLRRKFQLVGQSKLFNRKALKFRKFSFILDCPNRQQQSQRAPGNFPVIFPVIFQDFQDSKFWSWTPSWKRRVDVPQITKCSDMKFLTSIN